MTQNDDDNDKSSIKQIGVFITIPFVLAAPPIVGWIIGRWLDSLFGWTPYGMYLFLFLGCVAGFREVYRMIKRYGNE